MKDSEALRDAQMTRRTVIFTASLIPVTAIQAAPQTTRAAATVFSTGQRRVLSALVDETHSESLRCWLLFNIYSSRPRSMHLRPLCTVRCEQQLNWTAARATRVGRRACLQHAAVAFVPNAALRAAANHFGQH